MCAFIKDQIKGRFQFAYMTCFIILALLAYPDADYSDADPNWKSKLKLDEMNET